MSGEGIRSVADEETLAALLQDFASQADGVLQVAQARHCPKIRQGTGGATVDEDGIQFHFSGGIEVAADAGVVEWLIFQHAAGGLRGIQRSAAGLQEFRSGRHRPDAARRRFLGRGIFPTAGTAMDDDGRPVHLARSAGHFGRRIRQSGRGCVGLHIRTDCNITGTSRTWFGRRCFGQT